MPDMGDISGSIETTSNDRGGSNSSGAASGVGNEAGGNGGGNLSGPSPAMMSFFNSDIAFHVVADITMGVNIFSAAIAVGLAAPEAAIAGTAAGLIAAGFSPAGIELMTGATTNVLQVAAGIFMTQSYDFGTTTIGQQERFSSEGGF